MQLRKTPFALAALALCSPLLPLSAQTSSLTMEAESMTRSSYAIEGSRIKLTASTGSATKTFSGASGTYHIQVHVLLENDGRSTLELYKGSTRLHTYTYPLGTTAASFTVSNVALASGDTIRLVGRANAGAWARVDKIVFTPVAASTPTPAPSAGYAGTPYTGTPIALPKAFEAANFDKGGQGVAYRDLSAGNAGKLYRTSEDVDLIGSSDTVGGPYAVNNFQTGEWLAYTVNVPADGNYDLAIRAANNQSTPASFHIEVDGVNATGSVSVPGTGNWSSFQWVGKQGVPLKAGKRVIKVVSDQQYFNMSAVSVLASAGAAPAPTPTSPTPTSPTPTSPTPTSPTPTAPIVGDALGSVSPVTIEAESMTRSSYAVEGNLIKLSASSGTATKSFGGASGTYDMQVYVLPENDGRSTLEVYKGSTPLHSYTYPLGTSMTSFTVSNVALNQGDTLQLRGIANGGAWARVDKVVLTPSTSSAPTPAPTPTSPTPVPVPSPTNGTVQFSCSFENSATDCGFREQAKVAGRATLLNVARDGVRGVRLHTEPGDDSVNGSGSRERNDLMLPQTLSDCYEGKSAWWAHSVLFPSDFVMPESGLAFDFHHTGSNGQANFHLRVRPEGLSFEGGGGATVATQTMGPGRYYAPIGPLVKNQWYDFVYHVKWSSGSDGFFYAWVNGEQKLAHNGPTLYAGLGCYLKLANYHSPSAASSIVHDRVIRGSSASAVSLTPLQGVQ